MMDQCIKKSKISREDLSASICDNCKHPQFDENSLELFCPIYKRLIVPEPKNSRIIFCPDHEVKN